MSESLGKHCKRATWTNGSNRRCFHGRQKNFTAPPAACLDDKASPVIDHIASRLRAFDKDLAQDVTAESGGDIARAARKGGTLTDVEKRARRELETFFKRAGFESVGFRRRHCLNSGRHV